MNNAEKIAALAEHIKTVCTETGCRMLFVTYFDNGSDNPGPSIAQSIGMNGNGRKTAILSAWREMDRACNYMEPLDFKPE